MTISASDWNAYIKTLRKLNDKAADAMTKFMTENGLDDLKAITDYGYAVASKYGAGAGTAAADMYDAMAELAGKYLPPAEVAPLPSYGDVAQAIYGTAKRTDNIEEIAGSLARLVKLVGQDTTLRNAKRDGAEFAWVPRGDTCAFCIMLASNGWRNISKAALKNGHAEHIHNNCDCAYAVRFNEDTNVAGYDPDKYYDMYKAALEEAAEDDYTPKSWDDPAFRHELKATGRKQANYNANALRRYFYDQNKAEINAQKRSAYAKRKERESSAAEETDVN